MGAGLTVPLADVNADLSTGQPGFRPGKQAHAAQGHTLGSHEAGNGPGLGAGPGDLIVVGGRRAMTGAARAAGLKVFWSIKVQPGSSNRVDRPARNPRVRVNSGNPAPRGRACV